MGGSRAVCGSSAGVTDAGSGVGCWVLIYACEGVTCLGSAGAGEIHACGVLSLSILRPRCKPPSPGVGRPLLCSAVCGNSAGRTEAGSGVFCCACAGGGATRLIVVGSGAGVGLGGFVLAGESAIGGGLWVDVVCSEKVGRIVVAAGAGRFCYVVANGCDLP